LWDKSIFKEALNLEPPWSVVVDVPPLIIDLSSTISSENDASS
ncbi:hypothetical protein AVEN_256598-1, partial [Araneus ventricosus]